MRNPVLPLTIAGAMLGVLGVIGGPDTLFKGLTEMKDLTTNAPELGVGQLVAVTLIKMAALLRRIVERFEGEAQTRAIRFELFERAVAIVDGDALALDRVFANLLNNAFKFTPDGGRVSRAWRLRPVTSVSAYWSSVQPPGSS